MAGPIRIANCSGFFGDRMSAAKEMVEGGPIDVLTGDWLAELTMLILARTRSKQPNRGYATTFVAQMEQVMGACVERHIKVVSNAGGLDPEGCAKAVSEIAKRLGVHPKIAVVRGDDLMERIPELTAAGQLTHFETGAPIADAARFVTANAYLGCWGIVDALESGADIVITGRVTDAAVVCGPAAWHHGWKRTDWHALAGAVAAGHVIECGAQATGGNYSFFTEIPDMTHVGFPWAEIADDGSTVIGKHEGAGGEVSIGTITSQLLYEIGGPQYLGPDVTTRFDTVQLEQLAPDRVRVYGVQGEPPPASLKVCLNRAGGFRQDMSVCLTGLDIEAKAALVEAAFWASCPFERGAFDEVITRIVRTDKADPASNEEATAFWTIHLKDSDEEKVGRAVSNALTELTLATIPGFTKVGGAPESARPFGVYEPALISAELVPQQVNILGKPPTQISSVIPQGTPSVTPAHGPTAGAPDGPTVRAPLGSIIGARSGDKGGHANLGVFARSDEGWAWLDAFLGIDKLKELLPELAELEVERYRLPALRSLNFVIRDLLGVGVAASTRQDPQAKSLGEWLRARIVDLPNALL